MASLPLFTPHSLRIDAATTASRSCLTDWVIKELGRWSSQAYTYIYTYQG